MRKQQFKIVRTLILLTVVTAIAATLWVTGNKEQNFNKHTGFVVTNNIYLSAPAAGFISEISVKKGQSVKKGTTLFSMDTTGMQARLARAKAQQSQFEAQQQTQSALLQKAQNNKKISATEAERTASDYKRHLQVRNSQPGAISKQDLAHAKSAAEAAKSMREANMREVEACTARVQAAIAQTLAAKAEVAEAEFTLRNLSPLAPADGYIEDIMYQQGEWAAANAPVVSIVPEKGRRIRFYVPQHKISTYTLGTTLLFKADSMPAAAKATVVYIAPRPEYTPPVIYSLENREKLVFLLEAEPDLTTHLPAGMPLDVFLEGEQEEE
ncbi:HlyD family efflux transporter periplasmic adaptor subunit [Desulfovibrio sp. OttesenSCG-928-F07]|nr:HlyD family efflux transporter periplasmic adaptor subunit [Desulfovibrio sp. OttesenSCG-928-F07]